MSILDRLRRSVTGGPARGSDKAAFFPLHVRCRRCSEILTAEINLRNDLSEDYETGTFRVRKLITGSGQNRCFGQVEVLLTFDSNRRLIDRQAIGGDFLDEAAAR